MKVKIVIHIKSSKEIAIFVVSIIAFYKLLNECMLCKPALLFKMFKSFQAPKMQPNRPPDLVVY